MTSTPSGTERGEAGTARFGFRQQRYRMPAEYNDPVLMQKEGCMIACDVHQNFNRLSDLFPWADPACCYLILHAGFGGFELPNHPACLRPRGTPRRLASRRCDPGLDYETMSKRLLDPPDIVTQWAPTALFKSVESQNRPPCPPAQTRLRPNNPDARSCGLRGSRYFATALRWKKGRPVSSRGIRDSARYPPQPP
jgi:hypothetical protein